MNLSAPPPIQKVLIVDDHALFREGLVSLFRSAPDFTVVGEAGSVHEGIEIARQRAPDIVLMDYSMPDGTGLDATQAILARQPDCQIVFLTVHEAEAKLFEAVRAGSKGYMLKNVPSADLMAGLRALRRGEMAMSRRMASRVMQAFSQTPAPTAEANALSRLSAREQEVLREMATGASNQEIAARLYLSENTVKHHIRSILEKLGVENRHQAGLLVKHGQAGDRPPVSPTE